jgi:ubiquinone biosynthesis protein UbiJ
VAPLRLQRLREDKLQVQDGVAERVEQQQLNKTQLMVANTQPRERDAQLTERSEQVEQLSREVDHLRSRVAELEQQQQQPV